MALKHQVWRLILWTEVTELDFALKEWMHIYKIDANVKHENQEKYLWIFIHIPKITHLAPTLLHKNTKSKGHWEINKLMDSVGHPTMKQQLC